MTPILYNVESEKPDAVFEELSGIKFFVRHQPRTFKAIVVNPPTEWGINIEQLRCRSRLGVFLIDEKGVVWGRRMSSISAAPIPIEPATVQARLLFPTDSTTTKYEISFDFALSLMDFELVPVFVDDRLSTYTPPIAARLEAAWRASGSSRILSVFVYALYARSAGEPVFPISGLASHLELRDKANTLISTSFTEVRPGIYVDNTLTLSPSGNPYTIRVGASAPSGAFDYTTAVAQFNV
jgi:hypothetical protein